MQRKCWVVINLERAVQYSPQGQKIPKENNPTILFNSYEAAYQESERLAKTTRGTYGIFELVGIQEAIAHYRRVF